MTHKDRTPQPNVNGYWLITVFTTEPEQRRFVYYEDYKRLEDCPCCFKDATDPQAWAAAEKAFKAAHND